MEYAIRQSAALVNQGVEVHFLCKESFPKERLAGGIRVREFGKSRGARDERRASKKQARGLVGKIGRVINMISDLRANSKQVAEMAEQLAFSPSPVELSEKDAKRREKGMVDLTTIEHGGRCEKEQPEVGPKGEGVGTRESKHLREQGGQR